MVFPLPLPPIALATVNCNTSGSNIDFLRLEARWHSKDKSALLKINGKIVSEVSI